MAKTYIADKETLDDVKANTADIVELTGNGAGVKNVQTGAINYGVTGKTLYVGTCIGQYVDVTISAVDVTKAIVLVNALNKYGSSYYVTNPTAYLINSTTLRVFYRQYTTSGSSAKNDAYIRWQVVEFN